MKTKLSFLVFVYIFLSNFLCAQNMSVLKEVVNYKFVVNSQTALFGKNRIVTPVNLPPDIFKLNYTFAVTPANAPAQTAPPPQLLGALLGTIGYALDYAKEKVTTPFAGANVDFWLILDPLEVEKFKNGLSFNYLEKSENTHTIAQINACLSGVKTVYFCFANSHLSEGVNVELQAVAELLTPEKTNTGLSFCARYQSCEVFLECETGLKIADVAGGNLNCQCGDKRSKIFFVEPDKVYNLVFKYWNGKIEQKSVKVPAGLCTKFDLY